MAFSLASFLVWNTFAFRIFLNTAHRAFLLFCAFALFVMGSRQQTLGKRYYHCGLIVVVICLPWFVALGTFTNSLNEPSLVVLPRAIGFVELCILLGVVMDILFITFFRWVLRAIAEMSGLGTICLYLIAISVMTALLVGPAAIWVVSPFHTNSWVAYYVSKTNLVDALCLLLLILVMVLLLAHRLIWPLIKRPIYAANRQQLIKNTKLLGGIGTALVLYAFHNYPAVKWMTDHLPWFK